MNKERVRFLRYFNGYRMILVFQADSVVVASSVFMICYIIFTNAAFKISLIITLSFLLSAVITSIYVNARNSASKGYLRNLLFAYGIYYVQENKKKFEECKRLDVQGYLPEHDDLLFIE